jgi:hypothetical protein
VKWADFSGLIAGSGLAKLTSSGGCATLLTAGEALAKGTVVQSTTGGPSTVEKAGIACLKPVGVVANEALEAGDAVWVIVSGRALVLLEDTTAAVCGEVAYCSKGDAGRAWSYPTPQQEYASVGVLLESLTGGTDVLCPCAVACQGVSIDPTITAAIPTISSGSGAPGTTPAKIGDIYVDTSGLKLYFATGVASSSDWTIAN